MANNDTQEIRLDAGKLSERELQLLTALISLMRQVLRREFVAPLPELTPEQLAEVDEGVVKLMAGLFPDLRFRVDPTG